MSEAPAQEPTPPVVPEPLPPPKTGSRTAIYLTLFVILLAAGAVVWFLRFNTSTPILTFYPSQQLVSADWAGYTVSSDLASPQPVVTAVRGSWTVPEVSTSAESYSAAWVGIGGQYDESLIQTGTEHSWVNGQARYLAWYELLPADAVYLNMTLTPGDAVTASVTLQDSASDTWLVKIRNLSNNQAYQRSFQYSSTKLSAGWIVERPTINRVQYPLANFGNLTFTDCSAIVEGKTGGITSFPHSIVYLRGRMTNDLVSISNVSADGAAYTISFVSPR